ncbi:GNAT family N-acetyltransferase [Tessaracoccus defluvii]|uniref:GNAT family N-acetyltransferase n=1 Tax=Tessaracoccus defluvii TaxID=1285901 RepID=A0A7H0H3M4_9ACTN|nr:GNAT family N-acetyltransferase [Tessaracoccus defluvii]QNP55140.1 GNAT family N-acetyltransferase [Tessaracoccus defluvii]
MARRRQRRAPGRPVAATDRRARRPQAAHDDAATFAAFAAGCSAEEVDEAYVEVDHRVAFGAFDGDAIVAASSAYPWGDGAAVADIGVITAPTHRGRGLGRAVVRATARHILGEGLSPLYRCQATNVASAATGRGAGFTLFGRWDVAV